MEIEAKLESIESKIETYNTQIENLSSLITTLIHSFQQNQLPNIKSEILSKIEEKFQDNSSFPDVEEMKNEFSQIREDFSESQNGLNVKIIELDGAIAKLVSSVQNISLNTDNSNNPEIKTQLDTIEEILNKLSDEIENFKNLPSAQNATASEFPVEKIDAIHSLLNAQNLSNSDILQNIEKHFATLENSIIALQKNTMQSNVQTATEPTSNDTNMTEIKNRFDDLSLAITSVLSAIKIIDKKYTELKSFQDVIDKLTTDVVSPVLLASNDIKAFINQTSDNFEKINKFVEEYNQGAFDELRNQISDVNIDVSKILTLVEEFKTNSDLSNHTISDNMAKLENMLTEYNNNLTELTQNATAEAVKDEVKTLNDNFYLDLLSLFNSLTFDNEAEDIKDFLQGILSTITVKTDENSEKLNSIMLQFKNLLNKVEGIERTQNSISDYLKPEDTDELLYSFEDIQSDLAKMRLVLNDISKSISSSEVVDEISAKIKQTGEQIENVSKLLGTAPENDGRVAELKEQIEALNSQVYDISLRTNKLILSSEDSTAELKNNLEIFRDVCEKINPQKLYELFYELTNYFNDTNEKINSLSSTVQSSHDECVTIKNALIYVGEWLDSATNVLAEIRDNSVNATTTTQSNIDLSQLTDTFDKRITLMEQSIKAQEDLIQSRLIALETNLKVEKENMQNRLNELSSKIDILIALNSQAKSPVRKTTKKSTVKDTTNPIEE